MNNRGVDNIFADITTSSGLPTALTWIEVEHALAGTFTHRPAVQTAWLQRVWGRMVAEGLATCSTSEVLHVVLTRFLALMAFFDEFLQEFDTHPWFLDFCRLAEDLRAPSELISALDGQGQPVWLTPTPYEVLQTQIRSDLLPVLAREYPDRSWLAALLYQTVCPTLWDACHHDYIRDPDDDATPPYT